MPSYLKQGEVLNPGDMLVSSNGDYLACFDASGVLSLYYAIPNAEPPAPDLDSRYWQSPASPGPQPWITLETNDNLVFYCDPAEPKDYFDTNTDLGRGATIAVLQDDGNLVVCAGSVEEPQEILWSALPQVAANCKFMQNYRVNQPVNGGPDVLAIKNKAGVIELFTVGMGGDIHQLWPDHTSETGYSQWQLTTNLGASYLAGGTDAYGNIVLFASVGEVVNVLVENGDGIDQATRWSTPVKQILTPQMPVVALTARNIGGKLCVVATQRSSSGTYQLAGMIWGPGDKMRQHSDMTLSQAPKVVIQLLNGEPTATAVMVDKLGFWGLVTDSTTPGQLYQQTLSPAGIDITADHDGNEWIVAALDDGQVYRLVLQDDNVWHWVPMWTPISYDDYSVTFQDVVVETDSTGGVNVFAVAKAQATIPDDPTKYNVLYHLPPNPAEGAQPLPMHASYGMQLGGLANDQGSVDLFAVEANSVVTHLFAEQEGNNWLVERVLDPAGSGKVPIVEYASYTADVTIYDSTQAVVPDQWVDVYTWGRMRLEVDGLTFFTDESVPAHVRTNGAGTLALTHETATLSAPVITLGLPESLVSKKAPVIEIQTFADVHQLLGTATEQFLLDAKCTDDDGVQTPLLAPEYQTGTTPQSLADAMTSLLGSTPHKGELNATQRAGLAGRASVHMPGRRSPGTHEGLLEKNRFWSRTAPGQAMRSTALAGGQPFRLSFHDGGLSFEPLTAEEAVRLREERMAAHPGLGSAGMFDWWTKIGDALQAVIDGIVSVGHIVYDGLHATLDLIIDGVTYVFNAAVQFLEDAFDTVQMIFNHVKVFFQNLYRWLAWLFDWTSIKQTQIAISYSFEQTILFLKAASLQVKPIVDSQFGAFRDNFANMMQAAIDNIAGNYSVGGYDQANVVYDPDADQATSNNFVLNEFVGNSNDITGSPTAFRLAPSAVDPATVLVNQLAALGSTISDDGSFAQAMGYFNDLGTSPDQFFTKTLAGLLSVLKGIGLAGIDLANQIIDTLLDLIGDVLDNLLNLMNQVINIPFVSTFYKWVTGDDLTILNVMCLIAAIPTAIIYRITTGDPLFSSSSGAGSAAEFTNSFTYQNMLVSMGLAPASSVAGMPPTSKRISYGLASAYLSTNFVGGFLGAITEPKFPPYNPVTKRDWSLRMKVLQCIGIGFTGLSIVFSFPMFYAESDIGNTFEDQMYMGMAFVFTLLAFFDSYLDSSVLFPAGLSPNDIRALSITFFGALLLGQAGWNVRNEQDKRVVAYMVLARIPLASKFLRLDAVSAWSSTFSVYVLAFIDFACGTATSVLGYLVLRERYDTSALADPC